MEFYIPARVRVFIADLGRDDDQLIERTGAGFGFNDPATRMQVDSTPIPYESKVAIDMGVPFPRDGGSAESDCSSFSVCSCQEGLELALQGSGGVPANSLKNFE
jgi:hypothetical protein